MSTLNETELTILRFFAWVLADRYACPLAELYDAPSGFSTRRISGYLSSLTKKGIVAIHDRVFIITSRGHDILEGVN